jgi:hypothetical protein
MALALAFATGAPAATWVPLHWYGEEAYRLQTSAWRAVVSVERGRLVAFGPIDDEISYVASPHTRDEPIGWGGHRVWLGPQKTWRAFWPPPDAWEKSAAEKVTVNGARLELLVPDAGEGWPRFTRVYEPDGDRLACRIMVAAGGNRDVQVMQILQTRPADDLPVPIIASTDIPLGCLLLPPFRDRATELPLTDLPEYMTRDHDGLHVRRARTLDKIAFPPQELAPRYHGHVMHVLRGASRGPEVGAPDRGFYTQICPGDADTPIIELEQMSPLYRAGEAAEFTMEIDLSTTRSPIQQPAPRSPAADQ